MPRFYAPPDQWSGNRVSLDASEGRHAAEVLRLKVGDRVDVFDGCGRKAVAALAAVSRRGVDLELQSVSTRPKPAFGVTLVQALPKGKLMEWIIEKAVELGATRIVPVLSERTVVRLDGAERVRKQEKWFRVALEACKQCGQNWIPEVCIPQDIAEWLASAAAPGEVSLVGSLGASACPIMSVFEQKPFDSVRLIVGPEGDFSKMEVESFVARGALEVSLGKLTLRSETAALYMLSATSCVMSRRINLV